MEAMQETHEDELLEVTGGGPCNGFIGCVGYMAEAAGHLVGEGLVAVGEGIAGFVCYFAC